MTLYLRLGGRAAFTLATGRLKQRLANDPCFQSAAKAFSTKNHEDLWEFLIFLTGGAPIYENTPISDLLCTLCPSDKDFDAFVDHLAAALINNNQPVQSEVDLRLLMEHIRFYVVNIELPSAKTPQPSATGMIA